MNRQHMQIPTAPTPMGRAPYFDKVALWLDVPAPPGVLRSLHRQCGHLDCRNRTVRFDRWYRQRIEVKQPSDRALALLAGLAADGASLVNAVEFALDLSFSGAMERDAASEFIDRHLIRRWHVHDQKIEHVGDGYQTRYDGPRKAPNIIVAYPQRFSRATGEADVLHLEWRAKGVRAVRAAGIQSVADLRTFDHREFWRRRLLLVRLDPARLGRAVRNQTNGTKSRTPLMHPYRLAGRVRLVSVDWRLGHHLLAFIPSMQELIDRKVFSVRVERLWDRIDVEPLLPPAASTCGPGGPP